MQKNKEKKMTRKRLIICILMIILFLTIVSYPIFGVALTDPTLNPNAWNPTIENDTQLTEKVGNVLGIINTIGIVVAIIVLMMLGIKYMLGSIEEKAEYKKAVIPYIVGMFLLVSVTTLPNIIYKIVTATGFFG